MRHDMDPPGVRIHQFALGPWDNFIYFVEDCASRECAVVDPAWHAPSIFAEAERLGLTISSILCTHSHFDHVNRVDALLKRVDVPVHMLTQEVAFSGFRCENLIRNSPGDCVMIGKHAEIAMMHTPGHTPGSVSYRVGGAIITGDTLFVDGCGRCDFVGGDPKVMFETLRTMVDRLPPSTIMYPGHHYGPTPVAQVGDQRRDNPYLAFTTVADFVAHRMQGKTAGTSLSRPPEWAPT